jgi:hypothetical protein
LACRFSRTNSYFQPTGIDNAAQFFQAKIFASGRLYLPMPKEVEFFEFPFIFSKGDKWFSLYNPGYPFLLMLGILAGIPWLVNPLAGTGGILLMYKIGRQIYDEKTARLGTLMLLLTPVYLHESGGYMNHTTNLLFTLLFIYFYIRTFRTDNLLVPFISGFFLGATANIRPLNTLIIGLLFGLYVIIRRKDIESLFHKFLSFTGGCSITLGALFLYNYFTNGQMLRFNYSVYHRMLDPKVVTIGFGPAPWGIIHTPFRGLIHLWEIIYLLNKNLFYWPVASFVLIFLFFIFSPKITGWDRLFILTITGLFGAHIFFFVVRQRYFYAIFPLLALLSARGAITLPRIVNRRPWNPESIKVFSALFLIFCFYFPIRYSFIPPIFNNRGWKNNRLPRLAVEQNIQNAIIFVEGGWGSYLYGFNHLNPILEKNDIIYAHDLKTRNHTLAERFPNRKTYRYILDEGKIIPYNPLISGEPKE